MSKPIKYVPTKGHVVQYDECIGTCEDHKEESNFWDIGRNRKVCGE